MDTLESLESGPFDTGLQIDPLLLPSYSGGPEGMHNGLREDREQPVDDTTGMGTKVRYDIGGKPGPLNLGWTDYGMWTPVQSWLDGRMARVRQTRVRGGGPVVGGSNGYANLDRATADYPTYSAEDFRQQVLRSI